MENLTNGDDPVLKEQDRAKLDRIVKKMVDNKESDSNIKFVVNDFKKKYGSTPKKVTAEQNGVSSSASANTPSSSVSSNGIRPQSAPVKSAGRGLTPQPKTIFQRAQEDQMSRPKIGQEQKPVDRVDRVVEATEKRNTAINSRKDLSPAQKVRMTMQKPVKPVKKEDKAISQFDHDKQIAQKETVPYANKYDNSKYSDINEDELNRTNSSLVNISEVGVDDVDFARYLKNKTDFYNNNFDNYDKDEKGVLQKQNDVDKYFRGYIEDRKKFLEDKFKFSKNLTPEEKQGLADDYNNLNNNYINYQKKYLPELVNFQNQKAARNKELYENAKSGKGNALYQTGKFFESTIKGAANVPIDLVHSATDILDRGLKNIGFDGLDETVREQRFFKKYHDEMDSDGFDQGYASGKEVKQGKNTYIVTQDGNVIDKDTGSSINSFTDPKIIRNIVQSAKSSDTNGRVHSGVGVVRQIGSVAGKLLAQASGTRFLGGGSFKMPVVGDVKYSSVVMQSAISGSQSYNQTLTDLIDKGVSEEDARDAATDVGLVMAGVGGLTSMISPNKQTGKLVGDTYKKNIVQDAVKAYMSNGKAGFKAYLQNTVKNLPNSAKDIFKEQIGETSQELTENAAQAYGNKLANQDLDKKYLDESVSMDDTVNTIVTTLLATGATAGGGKLMEGSKGVFGMNYQEQFKAAADMDGNDFKNNLNLLVKENKISQSKADKLAKEVGNYKAYKDKLPKSVQGEKAINVSQLMAERDELKRDKKNLDEAFHPELDQKIEKLNAKITETLNTKDDAETTAKTETRPEEGNKVTERNSNEGETSVSQTVGTGKPFYSKEEKDNYKRNFDKDVKRITDASEETEDGHTFNLDGTTYDQGGLVIPVVSKNMKQSELTSEKIQEFIDEHSDKIDGNTVKVGIYKFPNSDEVSIDLNIVAPTSMRDEAIAFGKDAGQESLFDLDTFENVKTGADGKNPKSFTSDEFKKIARKFSGNESNQTNEQTEEAGGNQEGENSGNKDVLPVSDEGKKVKEFIDSPVKYKTPSGEVIEGKLKQDGQQIVVENDDHIYDLGNVDEVNDSDLNSLGVTVEDNVTINDKGNIELRGKEYVNNYSDPKSAINYDKNGNIQSVTLETPKGEKRTFRGQIAEDIAYQIHSKNFTEMSNSDNPVSLEEKSNYDKFIDTIDGLIAHIDRHTKGTLNALGVIPVAAKAGLKAIKVAAQTAKTTIDAIDAGINALKETDWYKGLSKDKKAEFDSTDRMAIFNEMLENSVKPDVNPETQGKNKVEKQVKTLSKEPTKKTKGIVRENTGQTDTSKKHTISEKNLLKDKFKNIQRGIKEGVSNIQALKKDFVDYVKDNIDDISEHLTKRETARLLDMVAKINHNNVDKVNNAVDNIVERLEGRVDKAKLKSIYKLQKKANDKRKSLYGSTFNKIANITKIDPLFIPKDKLDDYHNLLEKLAKGQSVNPDEVNRMAESLKDEINDYVSFKNEKSNEPKVENLEKKTNDRTELSVGRAVVKKMFETGKFKLSPSTKQIVRDFLKIPNSYFDQMSSPDMVKLTKALNYLGSSGTLSNSTLSDVVVKYNALQAANEIKGNIGTRLLKANGTFMQKVTLLFGKGRNGQSDFQKAIGNTMLQHIDTVIKGIKGTVLYDNIIHPVTSNLTKANHSTEMVDKRISSKFNEAIGKGNPFEFNVFLQMFFRQKEFELNPSQHGSKVFSLDEHFEATMNNLGSKYDDDSKEIIEKVYNSVKGKSSDEIFKSMSPAQKALVNEMETIIKDYGEKSKQYNDHILGDTPEYLDYFFPRRNDIGKGKPKVDGLINYHSNGAVSITGSSSNDRSAKKANPLNFNTYGAFMNYVREVNLESNLGESIKRVRTTVNMLKASNEKSVVKLAGALEASLDNLMKYQLTRGNSAYEGTLDKLFNVLQRNTYTRVLVDFFKRLPVDIASNYIPVYATYTDRLLDMKRANKNLNSEVLNKMFETISSTQLERLVEDGSSQSADYKSANSSNMSQAKYDKASPHTGESIVDLMAHNKISDFANLMNKQYYYFADRPATHLWKMFLNDGFKKETGKDIDGQRYLNDEKYRDEANDVLKKVVMNADKLTSNLFNTASTAERKLKVQAGANDWKVRINNFLRSFTNNEFKVFWDSLKGMTGGKLGETSFENKSDAARAFAIVNVRGIMYSYLGSIVGDMIVNFATDDDDETKFIDEKALEKSIAQHGMLIGFGNSSAVTNLAVGFAVELANRAYVNSSGKKYDPFKDSYLFVPNERSKFKDAFNYLGAEGNAVRALYDVGEVFYKSFNKYQKTGELSTQDLIDFKAAQISMSFISQATGAPLEYLGKLGQKVLSKKHPSSSSSSSGKSSSSGMGSGMGSSISSGMK